MSKILIVDDEVQIRTLLARMMELEGYEVCQAGDCRAALKQLELQSPDVALCDVFLPDGNGVDLVLAIKKAAPNVEVILLTAHGNIPDGVQAIKNGAFDYITKGDDNNKIIPLISRAMEKARMNVRLEKLEKKVGQTYSFESILGESKSLKEAVLLARKVAVTDVPVLLTGETGTGKEVFAQAIHYNSKRAKQNFVAVNCSSFSKELLESEMFGHKAGSFTGALKDKKGLFEEANHGTIFLDEIGEMAFELQAKLLRILETGEYIKIGDTKPTRVNVRIIAATNRADILDPALLRPGRFDRQVYVGRPDVKGREAILRVHAKGKPMASEVDLKVVAQTTAGFTGADLANLLNEAALLTARDGKKKIDMAEIQKALIKIGVGTEKKTRVISEKEKYITAYHEGGHAILFEVLSELDPVHSISIIPTGMAGGYTMPLPGEDRMYMTKMMMEQEIISLLGGRAAEELVIKDITTGASNDIERATSMARDMVTKYGMSELLGPIQFGGDNDEVFIGRDWGHARNYGEGVAATIDQEVNRIVTDAYREAKRLLQENMEMLHATAKLLVEKEKVTGDEFRSLFDQKVRNEVLGIANEAEQPTETAENREEN